MYTLSSSLNAAIPLYRPDMPLRRPYEFGNLLKTGQIKKIPKPIWRAIPTLAKDQQSNPFNQLAAPLLSSRATRPPAYPYQKFQAERWFLSGETSINYLDSLILTVGKFLPSLDFQYDFPAWFNRIFEHCLETKHILDLIEICNLPNIYKSTTFYNTKTSQLTEKGEKLKSLFTLFFMVFIFNEIYDNPITETNFSTNYNNFQNLTANDPDFIAYSKNNNLKTPQILTARFRYDVYREISVDKKLYGGSFTLIYTICLFNELWWIEPVTDFVKGGTNQSNKNRYKQVGSWNQNSYQELRKILEILQKFYNFNDVLSKCTYLSEQQKKEVTNTLYKVFDGKDPFNDTDFKAILTSLDM